MNKSDFKVGQTVFLVNKIGRPNVNTVLGTVKTIGRKYITVSYGEGDWQEEQFDMTNRFREKDGFDRWVLFLSKEDYEVEKLRREYLAEVLHFRDWVRMTAAELYDVACRIREFRRREESDE